MLFVISKLADLVLRPSTLLLLCCVGGLLLRRRWLLRTGVIGFVLVLLLPIDQLALLPLEDRFPRPAEPPAHVDGMIVLGGALVPELSNARGIPSLNATAERITETVALARRYPDARVVYTGAYGSLLHEHVSEAETAATLLVTLGVPRERIVIESKSRTTWENALDGKALVRPKPGETWLLVTSAEHMPRAVGAFRAAGWPVVAWPVAYKSGLDPLLWLPSSLGQHLVVLDAATHEWLGLFVYWWLGHSSAMFPAP